VRGDGLATSCSLAVGVEVSAQKVFLPDVLTALPSLPLSGGYDERPCPGELESLDNHNAGYARPDDAVPRNGLDGPARGQPWSATGGPVGG